MRSLANRELAPDELMAQFLSDLNHIHPDAFNPLMSPVLYRGSPVGSRTRLIPLTTLMHRVQSAVTSRFRGT